jgi:hypothetical protein
MSMLWVNDQVEVEDHERHVEDPGLSGCGAPPRPPRPPRHGTWHRGAGSARQVRRPGFFGSEYSAKVDEQVLDGLHPGQVRIIVDAGIP